MYAFTSNQLKGIAKLIDNLEEGQIVDNLYLLDVKVTDTDNDTVVGSIGYDSEGVYGFIPVLG